jgi:hypothetical protein
MAALLGGFATAAESARPISDEALRLAALRAIFPGMEISADRSAKKPERTRPKPGAMFFPDALADEGVYRVVGKAMNEAEKGASEDLMTETFSHTRQVQFRLFGWPGENGAGLLAVLQYDFLGARPAMACLSIGLLAHLVKDSKDWQVHNEYLLDMMHHSSLQKIDLLDLTGRGKIELLIESDGGGAGSACSTLQVFDLNHGRFDELVNTYSRLVYMEDDWFTQVLDIGRTRRTHGQQFCCVKTTLFENGKPFKPERVTHPCYKRGDGIDADDVNERNKLLAPLY